MKLNIQSIHFDADKKLIDFIQKKMDKLETFYDKIIEADIYLKLQQGDIKGNKHIQIELHIPGNNILAKEQGDHFEEAIDIAYETLKRQVSRHKEKMLQK